MCVGWPTPTPSLNPNLSQGNIITHCGIEFTSLYEPTFTPTLVDCDGTLLRQDGCQQLRAFKDSLIERNVNLIVRSGYRSYETQQIAYNQNRNNCAMLTAPPGTSDHQSGCAVDLFILSQGEEKLFYPQSTIGQIAIQNGLSQPIETDIPHWLVCNP